jgi:hypothetical protein
MNIEKLQQRQIFVLCNVECWCHNVNVCNVDVCNVDVCNVDVCNVDACNVDTCNVDLMFAPIRFSSLPSFYLVPQHAFHYHKQIFT